MRHAAADELARTLAQRAKLADAVRRITALQPHTHQLQLRHATQYAMHALHNHTHLDTNADNVARQCKAMLALLRQRSEYAKAAALERHLAAFTPRDDQAHAPLAMLYSLADVSKMLAAPPPDEPRAGPCVEPSPRQPPPLPPLPVVWGFSDDDDSGSADSGSGSDDSGSECDAASTRLDRAAEGGAAGDAVDDAVRDAGSADAQGAAPPLRAEPHLPSAAALATDFASSTAEGPCNEARALTRAEAARALVHSAALAALGVPAPPTWLDTPAGGPSRAPWERTVRLGAMPHVEALPSAARSALRQVASVGTAARTVEALGSLLVEHAEVSRTLRAFGAALLDELARERRQLWEGGAPPATVLALLERMRGAGGVRRRLCELAAFCRALRREGPLAATLPSAPADGGGENAAASAASRLLDSLVRRCHEHEAAASPPPLRQMWLRLLSAPMLSYVRALGPWLSAGRLDDPAGELPVCAGRDVAHWEGAHRLRPAVAAPELLRPLRASLLSEGQMQLLLSNLPGVVGGGCAAKGQAVLLERAVCEAWSAELRAAAATASEPLVDGAASRGGRTVVDGGGGGAAEHGVHGSSPRATVDLLPWDSAPPPPPAWPLLPTDAAAAAALGGAGRWGGAPARFEGWAISVEERAQLAAAGPCYLAPSDVPTMHAEATAHLENLDAAVAAAPSPRAAPLRVALARSVRDTLACHCATAGPRLFAGLPQLAATLRLVNGVVLAAEPSLTASALEPYFERRHARREWRELLPQMTLELRRALIAAGAADEQAGSFAFEADGGSGARRLLLRFTPRWPLQVLLEPAALAQHAALFGLSVEIRRALWTLVELRREDDRRQRATAGAGHDAARAGASRAWWAVRSELQHALGAISSNFAIEVDAEWKRLASVLAASPTDVATVRAAHAEYAESTAARCLLGPRWADARSEVEWLVGRALELPARVEAAADAPAAESADLALEWRVAIRGSVGCLLHLLADDAAKDDGLVHLSLGFNGFYDAE